MDKLLSNYPSLKMYLQKAIKMPLNPLCNFPEILHGKNLMVKSELSAIDYILRYQYIQEQSKQVGNVQPRVAAGIFTWVTKPGTQLNNNDPNFSPHFLSAFHTKLPRMNSVS